MWRLLAQLAQLAQAQLTVTKSQTVAIAFGFIVVMPLHAFEMARCRLKSFVTLAVGPTNNSNNKVALQKHRQAVVVT